MARRPGKRRKSVRCRICTKYRWQGNSMADSSRPGRGRTAKSARNRVDITDLD